MPEDELNVEEDLDSDVSGETKFIIYKSCLEKLFPQECKYCGYPMNSRGYQWKVTGTQVSVQQKCKKCSCVWDWSSQPFTGTMPWGNLIVSAAIFFSGSSPVKSINMLKFAGITCFTQRTYSSMQKAYLVPSVLNVWGRKQDELFDNLRQEGRPVKLGGDARCCSPGHTAKFGSYSVMDLQTSKVLDLQLVQVCNNILYMDMLPL